MADLGKALLVLGGVIVLVGTALRCWQDVSTCRWAVCRVTLFIAAKIRSSIFL
jgi:hypothetical protein